MKLYSKIKGTNLSVFATTMFMAVLLMVMGCEKPGNTYEVFDASNLRVVNGLSGRSTVKFYLDTFNLTLTGTVNYGASSLGYYVVKSGLRRAKFFSTTTKDTFASTNVQLDVKKSYSLFLAGAVASPKYFLTEDNLVSPEADKCKIRLANLAMTGAGVDLTIQKYDLTTVWPEVKVFSNVGSESVSNYTLFTVPISKGNAIAQPYNLRLYETGTTNLIASITAVDLRGTAINTIIAQGIRGGSPAVTLRTEREWLDW